MGGGLLNLVTVAQEQDGNFWTNNPIISNREQLDIMGSNKHKTTLHMRRGRSLLANVPKQKTSRDLKLPLP